MRNPFFIVTLACSSLLLYGCGGATPSLPPPLTTAAQLSVTSSATISTAGAKVNLTVTALDSTGTVVSGYADTVHFTSTDPQAVLPPDSKLTNGTGRFSATLKSGGGQNITATDTANSAVTGGTFINVMAGPVSSLTVTASASIVTVGISSSVAVGGVDAYGNTAMTYAGTVQLTSSDAHASFQPSSSLVITNGVGSCSVTFSSIGNQTITAFDVTTPSLKATSGSIRVVSNAATKLAVAAPSTANTRATFSFTVSAFDAAGNLSAGYNATVQLTSTDSNAHLPANATLTAGNSPPLSATMETAGMQTITATDPSSLTGSQSINVNASPALSITSNSPPGGTVGSAYNPHTVTICVLWSGGYCNQWKTISVSGFSLTSSGGVFPYTWSWAPAAGSSLPTGLFVVQAGNPQCPLVFSPGPRRARAACITGTPTQPGTFQVVVTITDSGLPSAQTNANYPIAISPPPIPVVNTTPPPPPGVVGKPYNYNFTTSAGYPPFTWSESGFLPNGLTFNNTTGVLSGTPTLANPYPITVTATDQFNQQSTPADFTVVISTHGFQATGSMIAARSLHTATVLGNGEVLIAGGTGMAGLALATAELFDPANGTFAGTGTMQATRTQHTATLLTNGTVLIAGGITGPQGTILGSAELYDAKGINSTATGNLQTARYGHTATLLNSGMVLLIGGAGANAAALDTAELFDPSTGTFSATGSMASPRIGHTATLLTNGKVLVTGGMDVNSKHLATAELYDPSSGSFTPVNGTLSMTRVSHTATLLNASAGANAGKVLLAGGVDDNNSSLNTAELFDPAAGSFTATSNMVTAHSQHTATLLNNGMVLVAGGSDASGHSQTGVELFDPVAVTFTPTGSLVAARKQHTASFLNVNGGQVLVTGGVDTNSSPLASSELYQ